ncbi:hypothetical protein [Halovivax gelatinilyticus]|uniref:hypothetical protein n=1 Tax=Halovivax gelatinilyticus TaxID=2961597 RepID=UPI0020CA60E6|nr:hypothetical protein [Halovivax gelatinilyticus]
MRYLVYTNTPAHVHLYRNAVARLEAAGHDVLVLGRDYGCTVALLEWYDLPHEVYGYCDTSKWSLFARLPSHYTRAIRTARNFDPDLIFGMGGYAAHTGALLRTPVALLIDSEVTGLDHAVSTPFARAVLTPDTFQTRLCDDHFVFPGLKECAYLHPKEFAYQSTRDGGPSIRDRLGLAADEPFVIVRLNAFGSHHDVGKGGFTPARRRRLIDRLAQHATVLVSDEGGDMTYDGVPARPFSVHPALLHDALAEASLLVADTQTMVTEAALLGTPAVRSNSFVGDEDMGNFRALSRHGLIFNEAEFDAAIERAETLLCADGIDAEWRRRRDAYLADRCNLTDVIVDVATAEGRAERVATLSPFGERDRAAVPAEATRADAPIPK